MRCRRVGRRRRSRAARRREKRRGRRRGRGEGAEPRRDGHVRRPAAERPRAPRGQRRQRRRGWRRPGHAVGQRRLRRVAVRAEARLLAPAPRRKGGRRRRRPGPPWLCGAGRCHRLGLPQGGREWRWWGGHARRPRASCSAACVLARTDAGRRHRDLGPRLCLLGCDVHLGHLGRFARQPPDRRLFLQCSVLPVFPLLQCNARDVSHSTASTIDSERHGSARRGVGEGGGCTWYCLTALA